MQFAYQKIVNLVMVLSLILSTSVSWAINCNYVMEHLSSDARTALSNAQGHYKVNVLHKEILGNERTIILLGETHIKDEEAAQLGKEVLSQFDYRGLEGAPIMKTWGGKVFQASVNLIYSTFSKLLKMDRESSTILSAQDINGPMTENIDIDDQPPNLGLNISSIALPTCIAGTCIFGLSLFFPESRMTSHMMTSSLGLVVIALPSFFAGLASRDTAIAKNIKRAFELRPEAVNLLVVFGEAHSSRVAANLVKSWGFEEVPLK